MAGSNNDINVLERSTLFTDLYNGKAPPVEYVINGYTININTVNIGVVSLLLPEK